MRDIVKEVTDRAFTQFYETFPTGNPIPIYKNDTRTNPDFDKLWFDIAETYLDILTLEKQYDLMDPLIVAIKQRKRKNFL